MVLVMKNEHRPLKSSLLLFYTSMILKEEHI